MVKKIGHQKVRKSKLIANITFKRYSYISFI